MRKAQPCSHLLGDQLNIAWYIVKRDLSSVRYCTVDYTLITFYRVTEKDGHVYLVALIEEEVI